MLDAAIGLADEGGIDALSMRRLADELGVEAMSLYHYVKGKDDLVGGMVDTVESEVELPAADAEWKPALRAMAISFHDMLRRHPWAASPMVPASPTTVSQARLRYMEAMLGRLRQAGFSANMTHHAYHALDSHIAGSTLWAAGFAAVKQGALELGLKLLRELPRDRYPYFVEHAEQHLTKPVRDGVNTFEFGLDLILDGLERIRDAGSGGSPKPHRPDPATRPGRRKPRTPTRRARL